MTALHDLIARFARIGATDDGGVCRLAGTARDKEARDLFLHEIADRGLVPRIDAIGNLFGVAMLAPASTDVVMTGSHLDSQPTGGRYDGVFGVLAGILAVEAVRERCRANPGAARRNLAVVNWTNEEGARFQLWASDPNAIEPWNNTYLPWQNQVQVLLCSSAPKPAKQGCW